MSLKERVYSVLVVSTAEKLNTALASMLPESRYSPVHFVSNISAAKRLWGERGFDFVIINSPLPDDDGARFAIDTAGAPGTVVLLMVRAELYNGVYEKVAEHGVFTLSKPLNRPVLVSALDWMSSARERLRKLEKKTLSVEEKMKEIRLVNRAKWLLIAELKMDEPQAHRYIEKQAMDRCISRREIAEEIIKTYT
ncbi:MAG: ANTAR domain-containing protein [Oscillospiraceae bacterium]|nr:ANTAR domain-containing protein [Oscillospiraceae bacterium]